MENDKRLEQKVVSARWRCSCWLEKRRTILKTAEEAPENALYIVGDGETSERIDEDNLRFFNCKVFAIEEWTKVGRRTLHGKSNKLRFPAPHSDERVAKRSVLFSVIFADGLLYHPRSLDEYQRLSADYFASEHTEISEKPAVAVPVKEKKAIKEKISEKNFDIVDKENATNSRAQHSTPSKNAPGTPAGRKPFAAMPGTPVVAPGTKLAGTNGTPVFGRKRPSMRDLVQQALGGREADVAAFRHDSTAFIRGEVSANEYYGRFPEVFRVLDEHDRLKELLHKIRDGPSRTELSDLHARVMNGTASLAPVKPRAPGTKSSGGVGNFLNRLMA